MQNVLSDNLVNPVFVHKKKHILADQTEADVLTVNTASATLTEN